MCILFPTTARSAPHACRLIRAYAQGVSHEVSRQCDALTYHHTTHCITNRQNATQRKTHYNTTQQTRHNIHYNTIQNANILHNAKRITTRHNTTNTTQQHNNTLQHNTTQRKTHYNTTQHDTLQHDTTQQTHYNTTQHNTTQHNTTQHNTKYAMRYNAIALVFLGNWCTEGDAKRLVRRIRS